MTSPLGFDQTARNVDKPSHGMSLANTKKVVDWEKVENRHETYISCTQCVLIVAFLTRREPPSIIMFPRWKSANSMMAETW